jgi:hypothetical protein
LPSYEPGDPTPFDRAELFDSLQAAERHYSVVLELLAGGKTVASESYVTRQGSASHQFIVTVPAGSSGPFTWWAHVDTATNVLSHDVEEGFEGRMRGAMWSNYLDFTFIAPWSSYEYPTNTPVGLWLNQGVQPGGSQGSQSAFLVVTNPPGLAFSGFGLDYVYPVEWALPQDTAQWTNYVFSFDFAEQSGRACIMEMQVKSTNEQWIQFGQAYTPATNQWNHIQATLDQFVRADIPGATEFFDPGHVKTLAVNIRMTEQPALYVASFDNIRFSGPETNLGGGVVTGSYSSANESAGDLSIQRTGSQAIVSWYGNGILQSADQINGPWTDVANASNPYPVSPLAVRKFYRLRR